MADHERVTDPREVEKQLTEQHGGQWTAWEAGRGGLPAGGRIFIQFQPDADGRKIVTGMLLLADGITSAVLRKVPVGAFESMINGGTVSKDQARGQVDELPALTSDRETRSELLALVAEHYKIWAQAVANPVAEMVAQSGVKSPTIHGWVREAREAGFLPPAQRGKRAAMKLAPKSSPKSGVTTKPHPRSSVKPVKMPGSRTTRKKPTGE